MPDQPIPVNPFASHSVVESQPSDEATRREELNRLFTQARWLAECAACVYPPESAEYPEEGELDRAAGDSYRTYRRDVRNRWWKPWNWVRWWKWSELNQKIDDSRAVWLTAHNAWVNCARERIENHVKKLESGPWANPAEVDVQFISQNGTEYFLAKDNDTVILCFRGTEPKMKDILTDLLAWQTEYPNVKTKPKIHSGFYGAMDGIWEDLKKELKDVDKRNVWITGHSLGGALASLAAYRLVNEKILDADQIGGVLTFGQPHVGDGKFANEYRKLKGKEQGLLHDRHYRFVNNCDIVTMSFPKYLWIFSFIAGPILTHFLPKPVSKDAIRLASPMAASEPPTPQQVSSTAAASSQQRASQAANSQQSNMAESKRTFEYSDTGRVVFANRANQFSLLTPASSGGLWSSVRWPFGLFLGRVGSWFKGFFTPRGFLKGFTSVAADHSMNEYNRILREPCNRHTDTGKQD